MDWVGKGEMRELRERLEFTLGDKGERVHGVRKWRIKTAGTKTIRMYCTYECPCFSCATGFVALSDDQ